MDNEYLYHLTFTLFKFTLKSFIFLKIIFDTVVSQNIFFFFIFHYFSILLIFIFLFIYSTF